MGLIAGAISKGLSMFKLNQATATEDDVSNGVTFFSKNKTIKTGRMPVRGNWGTTIPWGGSVTIPAGRHGGGGVVRATSPTIRGSWVATIAPGGKVSIPEGYHNGGGYVNATQPTQRGAWGATLTPGASVNVPEGYHNGAGYVSAKPLKTESKQARRTVGHGDTYLTCSGTLVGVGAITTYDDGISGLEISGNTLIVHTKGWSNYFTIIATLIYY